MQLPQIGLALATGLAGLGAGVVVTRQLHTDPHPAFWGNRLGSTRLRAADLPVGGTVALGAALLTHGNVRTGLLGAAVGMAAGALGVAVVDPLPPPG